MIPHGHALGLTLAALLISGLAACQKPAATKDAEDIPRTITVSGEGYVTANPDLAIASVGVVTQGTTAAEALGENSKRMTALLDLIKSLGIEAKDVQTSDLSVTPRYSVPDPAQPGANRIIMGYDASNNVTVRIRDIAKLGDVLDKFVGMAGANNLRGLSFDFANPEPLLDAARKNAVTDAKRKALLYVEAAGIKLGAIQSIGESGGYYPKSGFVMAERAAAPVPIAAGESRVTANVSITFALE
jgi:uncharacterized protein YggE